MYTTNTNKLYVNETFIHSIISYMILLILWPLYLQYMSDLERAGVAHGAMGIYDDASLLGNTLRFQDDNNLAPNGGFWLLKWYNDLTGKKSIH